jgi:hypothetical protein
MSNAPRTSLSPDSVSKKNSNASAHLILTNLLSQIQTLSPELSFGFVRTILPNTKEDYMSTSMATTAAATHSVAASEAGIDITFSEEWKEWQVIQDDSSEELVFSSIGKFLGDEPVPAVRVIISDDASELSSEYEDDDEEEEEQEQEVRCRRQPDMARENVKRGDRPHDDLSNDEIFASRTDDEGYAMVVVADKHHVDKQVAWNTDSEAYDSELSVNTKRTCNTTASTIRDDASCKTTDSPFFGYDKPKEKSKPSVKFGPPPGRVLSSKSSHHAEDESSMESESSDDEPFFDEVEPNKGMFELVLDKIIDGMLPHHGLDTPYCNYEWDENQEPSDSDPDDSSEERDPKNRESLFKADDDDDSVDIVDDEAVGARSVDEIEKLKTSHKDHQVLTFLDSFDCDDENEKGRQVKNDLTSTAEKILGDELIPDNRPVPFSVTIPNDDQGTKGLYANLLTQAVCVQGHGARARTDSSDPPGHWRCDSQENDS